MSRFFSKKYAALTPYTPGEQPRDQKYIKLNTNESPFPPSARVLEAVSTEAAKAQLYSDPECFALRGKIAEAYGVSPDCVIAVNGSDEVLNFAFMAFGDKGFAFPDISYGFYKVFADVNNVPYTAMPINADFTINLDDYIACGKSIVIPNPNAPTGILLSLSDIEKLAQTNPDSVVIIDEAYIDFGGVSAINLTKRYDNLLVTRTFSKSFSLAGARLGFAVGSSELIADLNTIRNSTNPYNVNRMTQAAGIAALEDMDYYMSNAQTVAENRAFALSELKARGFEATDSTANFIFVKAPFLSGGELYARLREKGILVRHWDSERISDYCRITIGTKQQMEALIAAIDELKEEITQ